MRAVALPWLVALVALAGCGGSAGSGSDMTPATTGLVLTLHFSRYNVQSVWLSGATSATSRRFGPYVVSESDLPRDSTVGLVFDAKDAGSAMVCGESHDSNGQTVQQGCGMFDIVGAQVTNGSLTLVDPR
ncbi:MAG TPA: hypothetical protein VF945_16465 [Polyangia bacterium]